MRFPLDLTFKLVAIAPQISVTDAAGQLVFYVKQKAFKLKEAVTVYGDTEQRRALYTIAADRILDWNAQYHVTDAATGGAVGTIRRAGARSLWRTHYEVDGPRGTLTIREENPWVKVADGVLGQLPVVGLLTAYFLHPTFIVSRADGTAVLRLRKRPAFFEGRFGVTQLADMGEDETVPALLGLLMLTLLERARG